jgi:hypothetical protein
LRIGRLLIGFFGGEPALAHFFQLHVDRGEDRVGIVFLANGAFAGGRFAVRGQQAQRGGIVEAARGAFAPVAASTRPRAGDRAAPFPDCRILRKASACHLRAKAASWRRVS